MAETKAGSNRKRKKINGKRNYVLERYLRIHLHGMPKGKRMHVLRERGCFKLFIYIFRKVFLLKS